MSSTLEEQINAVVNNVASICNITEWQHSQHKFESIAQNYFGILVPVVLTGKRNEEEVSISIVLKLAPTDPRYRVSGAVTQMFAREIYVYSTILEKYQTLQKTLPVPNYIIPRCYYICKDYCQEVIVMQNMCADGYKPYTRGMFLDLNHITISINSLAKFHAMSFIIRKRDSNIYEAAKEVCLPLNETTNKRFMEILKDRLIKAIRKFENTNYVSILKNLEHNCVSYVEQVNNLVEKTCICHGDIWKENIMFKYEENNPVSACLIDYQTTRICSPAFDVLYLIASSTDTHLRQQHFKKLLHDYYSTFNETLLNAGFETREIYSREMFDNDLKVVAPACVTVANTALWLSNGLQEEGHVRSKQVWSTEEDKARAVDNYKITVKGIIDDFINYSYLCTCL